MSASSMNALQIRLCRVSKSPRILHNVTWVQLPHFGRRYASSIENATGQATYRRANEGGPVARSRLQQSALPPHSLLPTKMLLRSLLVSSISSSPLLLRITLDFLLLLTQRRFALLDVSRNRVLYALLKKTFYEHFCAGENRQEVTSTIQNIKQIGFKGVILTYAREVVVDERTKQERGLGAQAVSQGGAVDELQEKAKYADVEAWRSGVLDTLEMVGAGDFLALKFTGAGQTVTQALRSNDSLPEPMQAALDTICARALQRNVRILVDAEQQSVQPAIDAIALGLMAKYNRDSDKAVVYNTYQMYLKSTQANLNRDMAAATREGYTLGVKIVRGAYMNSEPRHLIHNTKEDTDRAYDGSVRSLLNAQYIDLVDASTQDKPTSAPPPINLFVASHNKESALAAVRRYNERMAHGLMTVNKIEYGQLLGMADEVSCALLQLKGPTDVGGQEAERNGTAPEVYKCLSWGTLEDCLSYLLRRAVENKDAVSRTKSEAMATRKELWRRLRAAVRLT